MSREMAIVVLGVWVLILPHLGVPHSWTTALATLTGLVIIGMGLYLRAAHLTKGPRRTTHHPFIENTHTPEKAHEHSDEFRG